MFVRVSEMSYFYDLEKPGTFVVANRFFSPPGTGTDLCKTRKIGTPPGRLERTGSLSLFLPNRRSFTLFSGLNTSKLFSTCVQVNYGPGELERVYR